MLFQQWLADIDQHVTLIRWCSLGIAFIIGYGLQFKFSYYKNDSSVYDNMYKNFTFAIINAIIVTMFTGQAVYNLCRYLAVKKMGLFHVYPMVVFIEVPAAILLLDLTSYFWHRANHKIQTLWAFHIVHHSDIKVEVSTALRFHFGEIIISLAVRCFVIAIFGMSLLSVLAFELLYQTFNFFEHGHTRLPGKWESQLSRLFVTPVMHRKHHSIRWHEMNSNFGTIFSFWDRLFRTYESSPVVDEITVGLPEDNRDRGLEEMLKMPLQKLGT